MSYDLYSPFNGEFEMMLPKKQTTRMKYCGYYKICLSFIINIYRVPELHFY